MFGEGVILQLVFKSVLIVLGILLGRLTLFWMDVYAEHSDSAFSRWLEKADDRSKAIYYAGRLVFVGLIVGSAIS